jgi:hypothetical protein
MANSIRSQCHACKKIKGKQVARGPCQLTARMYPLSLQQILALLMSSCGYTHRFVQGCGQEARRTEDGEEATSRHKQGARSSWGGEVAKPKTTHTFAVLGGVLAHLKLLWQPAGRRKPVSSLAVDGASSLRNSRIALSAGRRACKPAAKPAMPGVILPRYGFVCYERTRYLR